MEKKKVFIHRIDESDRLVFLNDEWITFARENWSPSLQAGDFIGEPIWKYITDADTRHLYSLLLDRIRKTQAKVTIPYRCDSPDKKRFMEMVIAPSPDYQVEFQNRIVKEEPHGEILLLRSSRPRSNRLIAICSWCKKVRLPEWLPGRGGEDHQIKWLEIEEFMPLLGPHTSISFPAVTHTACEACYEAVMKEIDSVKSNRLEP